MGKLFKVPGGEYLVDSEDYEIRKDEFGRPILCPLNQGGGGDQPKLYAPEIKITGDTLTIIPNTDNGAFVTGYNGYMSVDGGDFELYGTLPSDQLELDLTAVGLPDGDFQFKTTAIGTNFQDSDASNVEDYTNVFYTVTNTLTNCTSNNGATSARKGSAYTATLTAEAGYTMNGATVTVTMDGVDITNTAYADGVITINTISGEIGIIASAVDLTYLYDSGYTYALEDDGAAINKLKSFVVSPSGGKVAFLHNYNLYVYDVSTTPYEFVSKQAAGSAVSAYEAYNVQWLNETTLLGSGYLYNKATGFTYLADGTFGSNPYPTGYQNLGRGKVCVSADRSKCAVILPYTAPVKLYVFDTTTTPFSFVKEIEVSSQVLGDIAAFGFVSATKMFVGAEETVYFIDTDSSVVTQTLAKYRSSLSASANASRIVASATISQSSSASTIDIDTYGEDFSLLNTVKISANSLSVTSAINIDSKVISFNNNVARIYDADATEIQSMSLDFSAQYPHLAISPRGNRVFCVDTNGVLHDYFTKITNA